MSFLEDIKKLNEKIRGILPENIVHFSDDLVEIQLEAIHKTLDCADKHKIEHSDALCALVSGLKGAFEHFDFCNYKMDKNVAENTCKDKFCEFHTDKEDCPAKEGCAGYTPEEQTSWKDSMMKHFVKGE